MVQYLLVFLSFISLASSLPQDPNRTPLDNRTKKLKDMAMGSPEGGGASGMSSMMGGDVSMSGMATGNSAGGLPPPPPQPVAGGSPPPTPKVVDYDTGSKSGSGAMGDLAVSGDASSDGGDVHAASMSNDTVGPEVDSVDMGANETMHASGMQGDQAAMNNAAAGDNTGATQAVGGDAEHAEHAEHAVDTGGVTTQKSANVAVTTAKNSASTTGLKIGISGIYIIISAVHLLLK